jgi:hypothetical protein
VYQKLTTLIRPAAARLAGAVAACTLLSAGAVATLTAPAAAAGGVVQQTIRSSYNYNCLDQHFDANGEPTTTVWMWPDCHNGFNQRWWISPIRGTNTFTIVNVSSGWCLSAPENSGSKVFAEVCVRGAAKQTWGTSVTVYGHNVLAVQRPGASCMYMHTNTELRVVPNKIPKECHGELSTYNWYWYDA